MSIARDPQGAFEEVIHLLFMIGLTCIVFFVLAKTAHCATTSSVKHGNSLGVVIDFTNPNRYVEGQVQAVAYVGTGDHKGLVLRIQPRGTFSLFTEDLLFCGEPVDLFIGKTNPMVLTYENVAHTSVEGIGCHILKSVDEVKTQEKR
jgi:hypothetical protein